MGAMVMGLEFASPGTSIFLGAGITLIIAAIIGLLALPVQSWAIALIILGLVLVGFEFFVTSHGALALSGLALLSIGGLNMIDPLQAPGVGVALWAIIVIALSVAGLAAAMLILALRSRKRPVSTGQEALIGRTAEVRKRLDPQGMVFVEGALWQACLLYTSHGPHCMAMTMSRAYHPSRLLPVAQRSFARSIVAVLPRMSSSHSWNDIPPTIWSALYVQQALMAKSVC